jgi:hypothetical protein
MTVSARLLHDFFRNESEIVRDRLIYDEEGFRIVVSLSHTDLSFKILFRKLQAFQVRDEIFTVGEFAVGMGVNGVGLYEISGGSFLDYTQSNSGAWPRDARQYTVVLDDDWIDVLCCEAPTVERLRASEEGALTKPMGKPA